MDELEQAAAKHGLIRMFFHPEEAVLVASCLSWVLMDIQTTVTELEKLPSKSDDSREPLDVLRKLCNLAWQDIIEYSAIHFKEMNDEKGFENWRNLLMEMEKGNLAYRQLRDYVSIGSKLESLSEKQK